ncbi:MAG TPA: hypothetical protein VJY31_16395 [Buttiauxella sp.]|nr:hypothetical protein [Buttiauxella sp.]
MKTTLYKWFRSVPVMGAVFRIVNAYAYLGDSKCHSLIAPLHLWWDRVFKKMVYVFIFTGAVFFLKESGVYGIEWEPSDSILSIFPSILGFGIGAFALLFVMPSHFMDFINGNKKKLNFGPEIILVDMAYPLLVYTMVMLLAGINKIYDYEYFKLFSAWAFFYGLAITLELISFLFNTSVMIRVVNANKDKKTRYTKRIWKGKER